MPIDRTQLEPLVTEIYSGDKAEQLIKELLEDQDAATKFVGQRLRHDDYTKKTQGLSEQKKQLESQATEQIRAYATQVQAAQGQLAKVMKDLEDERITASTANARLQRVKETYNLSDDDIPAVEGVRKPAGTGDASGIDIDAKLAEYGKYLTSHIVKQLREDMLSLPRLTAVQSDIQEEHKELTGKRMTRSEMTKLLEKAEKENKTLLETWEAEHDISSLRQKKSDESKRSTWRKEWEDELTARRTNEAMSGVRSLVDPTKPMQESSVFKHQFSTKVDPAGSADKSSADKAQLRKSGAERAAERYLERRNKGIGMGVSESK